MWGIVHQEIWMRTRDKNFTQELGTRAKETKKMVQVGQIWGVAIIVEKTISFVNVQKKCCAKYTM